MKPRQLILLAQLVLCMGWAFASGALAVDAEPHLKTKLCGPDETYCTDVSLMSGVKRARVDALLSGGTDGTPIGNVGDALKVNATVIVTPAPSTFGTILRQNEVTIASKTETDLTSSTYTVPAGKTFVLLSFGANYDTQSPVVVRFKKQTGGSGSFATLQRLTLKQHGQDASNVQFTYPLGIQVGTAGDVFKITYESALSKGSFWASFTGIEY